MTTDPPDGGVIKTKSEGISGLWALQSQDDLRNQDP
jgi:hypothetical protein